jgi:hypothetical protein
MFALSTGSRKEPTKNGWSIPVTTTMAKRRLFSQMKFWQRFWCGIKSALLEMVVVIIVAMLLLVGLSKLG